MRTVPNALLIGWLTALVLLAGPQGVRAANNADEDEDLQILKKGKIGSDNDSLLNFLRKRSLTDDKHEHLLQLIRDLGSTKFAARRRATRELIVQGPPALPYLREAVKSPDVEIVARATRCIKEIERGPGAELPAAVVRLLARRAPAKTVETLLAYLPFADNEVVAEEVITGLQRISQQTKKLDPALAGALRERLPARRGAAAYLVAQAGDAKQRDEVARLLKDSDVQVRLQAAHGLAAARDKRAVPVLISLVRDAPDSVALRAEDILYQIAGEKGPGLLVAGENLDARQKAAAAWETWWRDRGPKIDWKLVEVGLLGGALIAELETDSIWEISSAGKVRWEMADLQGPYDVQVLVGGRVLVAEYLGRRVSERDRQGTILWQTRIDNPVSCRRLPGGNTFIATEGRILEITPAGKEVYSFTLPKDQQPVYSAHAVPTRHSVYIACKEGLLLLDTAEKVARTKKLDMGGEVMDVQGMPGGHLLVTADFGMTAKLTKINSDGKPAGEWTVPGASSAAWLANGQILAGCKGNRRLLLIDPTSGKKLWKRPTEGRPIRVRRR